MAGQKKITSGIRQFDRLIDGLYIGDNVVWHDDSGSLASVFCLNFIHISKEQQKPLVYISFDRSPKNLLHKLGPLADYPELILLDGFTHGKGKGAPVFLKFYAKGTGSWPCRIQPIENPADPSRIMAAIDEIHAPLEGEVRFVFESLTGMQELWGGEEHIATFYSHTCPRLYEMSTVAYWILEKQAHSKRLRAQINQIAQVAIDLSVKRGSTSLTVMKAEKRAMTLLNRPYDYWNEGLRLSFDLDNRSRAKVDIGGRIKGVRLQNGLSQKELAKLVGVTPSSISQVEGNLAYPSLPALLKMAQVLGVAVSSLFPDGDHEKQRVVFSGESAWKIKCRIAPENRIDVRRLLPADIETRAQPHLIEIPPGVTLSSHFFFHKGEEAGYLLSGKLQVKTGREIQQVEAGDTIYLKSEMPEEWRNPGPVAARLFWLNILSC